MTITTDKPDIADVVKSLGVSPARIEDILDKIHTPENIANMDEKQAREVFASEYPHSAERIFNALYGAKLLKIGLGSGHGGSGDKIVTVDWDSWYAAYPIKQQP